MESSTDVTAKVFPEMWSPRYDILTLYILGIGQLKDSILCVYSRYIPDLSGAVVLRNYGSRI